MAFKLKNIIFNRFFTSSEYRDDINKDVNGDGTLKRFVETVADDWDEEVIPLVEQILERTLVPESVEDRFIPYLEDLLGLEPISSDLEQRRRLLKNVMPLRKTKGTVRSYQIIFRSLGFTDVEIVPVDLDFGFDSEVTFDATNRVFDQGGKCAKCGYYILNLIGDFAVSEEMMASITKAIAAVEPVYAHIYAIQQNGDEINIITIFVDVNGDLIIEVLGDFVAFSLSSNGDLIATGSHAYRYSLANNGDIIYTS